MIQPRSSLAGVGIGATDSPGSVLTTAQGYLKEAGYSDVTCRKERVYYPKADGTSGYYDQDVCSPAGWYDTRDANLVATQSQNARGYGTGVDLAAERAYQIRQGGGSSSLTYLNTFGNAPNVQVLETLSPGGMLTTQQSPGALLSADYQRSFDSVAAASAAKASKDAATGTGNEVSTQDEKGVAPLDFDFQGLLSNPYVLAGVAGVALLFLMKGK